MDDICVNIFRSVNYICYDDDPFPPVDEDRSSTTSSSRLSNTTETKPRREILWHTADVSRSDTNLHAISQQYGSFIHRHMDSRHQVPQLHVVDGPVYCQCTGYQRDGLNLTHHILYNNVLVSSTPSIDEICVICGKPLIIPLLERVVGELVCDFCQIRFCQGQRLHQIIKWRCWESHGIMSSKQSHFHHLRFTCPFR
ncbi:hypothetical protein ARMGADRAFT_459422 [Armillaria gallica]|uniref:Uncharacterized protein n=1 Tax=Armillaria gallica TaxID=47427 RepID=A0A2H3DJB9_ARMGA|nr:hypothetical protein ARMGADRAFT_459422 [Armillaria gallica]